MSRKNEYYTEDQYEQDQREEFVEEEAQEENVEYDDSQVEEGYEVNDELDELYDDVAENDVKFVYDLIYQLETRIEGAGPVRFNSKLRAMEAETWETCMDILEDLKRALPSAVKRGAWAYNRSDVVLQQTKEALAGQEIRFQQQMAKREKRMEEKERQAELRAKRIIEDAQRQADAMVRQGVIESRVSDEVARIQAEAENEANELMLQVEEECRKRLDNVSVTFGKMVRELSQRQEAVNASYDNMNNVMGKMIREVNGMRKQFEQE